MMPFGSKGNKTKKSVSSGLTASRAKAKTERKTKRAAKVVARGAKKANRLNARANKVVAKSTTKANNISPRKITAPKTEVKVNVKKSTPKVTKSYNDMSFSQAFKAARKAKGAGKSFAYKGKKYTTNTADEVKSGKQVRGNAAGPKNK